MLELTHRPEITTTNFNTVIKLADLPFSVGFDKHLSELIKKFQELKKQK